MTQPSPPTSDTLSSALSPLERGCEIVFGLLMVVSITAAEEIRSDGQAEVHALFIAALGCTVAWGLIDGVIYLLNRQFTRFRDRRTLLELRATPAEDAFRARVQEELPPLVGTALTDDTYARIRSAVDTHPAERARFWPLHEWGTAGVITVLVASSSLPLVLPFLLMTDARLALRVSHLIAIVLLFILGWRIGRWSGASAPLSGTLLALLGVVLGVTCILLGG
ncbi:hypothetical protein ACVNIS_03485 [Sphaerotilaceae bacterium SBD11-9]